MPCKVCSPLCSHQWIRTGVTVRKFSIRVKIVDFLSRVTFKFDSWPWKTTKHIPFTTSTYVRHFVAINELKLELQSKNAQFGSKLIFFVPCDLQIWQMTLKNFRAPLLCQIKLCTSFHCHMWIQTGVTIWKRPNWVLTFRTLTFDLWPWHFAWAPRVSLVIIL